MPKGSPIQPGFSGGEFSPRYYGRVDSERYRTGMATCLNYLPTTQGPIVRRPGFKYVGTDVKDASKPPILVPFEFSQSDAYVLEIGHTYIRFFTNEGRAVTTGSCFTGSGLWSQPDFFTGVGAFAFGDDASFYAIRSESAPRTGELFYNGSSLLAGSHVEIPTSFTQTDLADMQFVQAADTMYILSPKHMPYKLQRFGAQDWTLRPCFFVDGPYMPFNSHLLPGDSSNVTLTPQAVGFKGVMDVLTGPRVTITNTPLVSFGTNSSFTIVAMSTATNPSYYVGQSVWVDASINTTLSGRVLSVHSVGSSTIELRGPADLVINGAYVGSGFIAPNLFVTGDNGRLLSFSQSGKRYWGFVNSPYNYGCTFIQCSPGLSASATAAWQMGSWGYNSSWPSTGCFHQDRLFLGGDTVNLQQINASKVGDYENFQASNSSYIVADNNALQFTLNSAQLNKINWLSSQDQGLLVGTYSSEWKVAASNEAQALTPTNVTAKETSKFGSATAPAIKVSDATLYIQRAGREIRALNYFFQVNTYRSTDVAEMSNHLTAPKVTKLVSQQQTVPTVWGLLGSTEQLISGGYSRDDQALNFGWARHQLGGRLDSAGSAPQVKSMAVIPSPDGTFDQMWIAAKRFINGTSVISIEYSTKPYDDSAKQQDAFHFDMGATYNSPVTISGITVAGSSIVSATAHGFSNGDYVRIDSVVGLNSSYVNADGVTFNSNLVNAHVFRVGSTSANAFFLTNVNNGSSYIDSRSYSAYVSGGEARKLVSTISGLTWLKNETVSVLADGKVHPDTIINSAGVMTLSYPAAKVQIGYSYNSDGKLLRPEAGSADGTSIGKMRRVGRAAFMLHNVGDFNFGTDFARLTPIEFMEDGQAVDTMIPLFSGIKRESVEGEHNFEGQVCFRQNTGLPGMVQAVTVIVEENDV